ncbi:hypothetical protein GALL_158810 [mine drainage metagenome]|uniref:Cytochrome C oxidase subunit IV n=1 Tax=mine drainage metagenome TaxID=410659 RepID=A0A1J5S1D5_9ZZZZ
MTTAALPSFRALLLTWLTLMGLTIVLLAAGDPTGSGRLPLLSVTLLLAVALIKARQILWVFLGLARSSGLWKGTFLASLTVILALVLGCAGLAPLLAH